MDIDNNLGPEIMEREKYIKTILTEHLLNKDGVYLQISKVHAEEILEDFTKEFRNLISFYHGRDLDDELKVYFSRGFQINEHDTLILRHIESVLSLVTQYSVMPS